MEPHPRGRGKRGERRRPEHRTVARARLHDVSQMAHPGKVRVRYLLSARGHAKDPAYVFAKGAQSVGALREPPLRGFACHWSRSRTLQDSYELGTYDQAIRVVRQRAGLEADYVPPRYGLRS